jgi:hypothetical protein
MLPVLAGTAVLSLLFLTYVLMAATSAGAAGPAAVTFRAVGGPPQYETVVPLTQVTTTTEPVARYGGSCSGTSAAGALQLGTAGNWGGAWSSKFNDYEVMSIEGKEFPFDESSPANYYWSFWLDNKESPVGVCEAELSSGDQVLFFPACYGTSCPPAPNVLAIEAPATTEVGQPTTVTVLSYPNAGGEPKPAVGATVEGGGDADAPPTNAQGQTTLVFSGDGNDRVDATAPTGESAIRGEAFVCAHEGNDGTCGTTAPSNGTRPTTKSAPVLPGSSPAVVETAKIAGVKNGHAYSRRAAPRLLRGSVVVPAGGLLRKVQISLKRNYRGRCYAFNGSSARFAAIKCKQAARFFSVGTKDSFSYLLPARLPRGLYTFDIEAIDGAGQATKLVSGVSHVVFRVE